MRRALCVAWLVGLASAGAVSCGYKLSGASMLPEHIRAAIRALVESASKARLND